ncbi:hypothetical protein HHI36_017997, partial [Cryptolaemus montrouzieri]
MVGKKDVSKLEIKLKRIDRKSTGRPVDIRKLHNPEIKREVQISISNTITNATNNNGSNLDQWDKVREAIQVTCTQLPQKEKKERKEWMTDEILGLMEERRTHK